MLKRNKLLSWGLTMAIVLLTLPLNTMTSYAASFAAQVTSSVGVAGAGAATVSWNKTGDNVYKVYKSTDGTNFETVGVNYETIKQVRVLQVYPIEEANGQLQKWLVDSGYGKGLIRVDSASMDNFNLNPLKYLKNSSGEYQYDVVFFGTWDRNADRDLSSSSYNAMDAFIASGRGCIFGHDTVMDNAAETIATREFSYSRLKRGQTWFDKLSKKYMPEVKNSPGAIAGSSEVEITKRGLFTTYPNFIGDPGTVLNIPYSHSWGQYIADNSLGNIWMKYKTDAQANINFYLYTHSNLAIIQTGHSNGQSTSDEQKILANLVFYTVQLQTNSPVTDNTAMDYAAPNAPVLRFTDNETIVSVSSSDNGTDYYYKVEEFAKNNTFTPINISNVVKGNVATGIQEYRYVVDTNPGTKVSKGNSSGTSSSNIAVTHTNVVRYLHVAAVDKAGNISSTSTVKLKRKDQTAPIIKSVSDTYIISAEDDGRNKEDELVSDIKGFTVTTDQTIPSKTSFKPDTNLKNLASNSGHNYAWAIDTEGNVSAPYKIFIHSDLYYNDKEVHKVVYNNSPLSRFLYNLKGIFF